MNDGGPSAMAAPAARPGATKAPEPAVAFLGRAARALAALPQDGDLFGYIADQVRDLVGDCVILVGSYEPRDGVAGWRALATDPPDPGPLSRWLGPDVGTRTWLLPEPGRTLLARRGLHALPGGLRGLLGAQPEAAAVASLTDELALRSAHGLGLAAQGQLHGMIVILRRADAALADAELVLAFADLASLALARRHDATAADRSERRYRELLDLLPGALLECDLTGRITFVNRTTLAMSGHDEADVRAGLTVADLLVPEDRERAVASVRQVLAGAPASGNEYRALRKDGSRYDIAVYSTPISEDGRVTGMLGIAIDITQSTRAWEALQDSERRFRELVDLLPVGVVECDAGGTIRFANAHVAEMTGYTPADVRAGLDVMTLVVPAARERVRRELAGVVAGETHVGVEYQALRKDGTTREVAIYASPLTRAGAGVGFRGVAVDITEHKRAEEQQRALAERAEQARKLESLGVLTGGIAHDFNNLLVAVLGNAELALLDLAPESAPFARVAKVRKVARRAAELVNQLLAYAGGGSVDRRPVDLNALLADLEPLLQGTAACAGGCRYEYGAQLPCVHGDATQLRQIAMNLIINAAEATSGSPGTVTVRTGLVQADAALLAGASYGTEQPAGPYVSLEVADGGCGMDAATLPRIFEPFFSTKFTGRGLGLAAVLGIVRGHRGAIMVTTAPGHGSTFTVLLPPTPAPGAVRGPDGSD